MGPIQRQGCRETEGTAHLPALPPARLRAEDKGPDEGGGKRASIPDPAYHLNLLIKSLTHFSTCLLARTTNSCPMPFV